jgi:hypothetical protein
MLSKYTYRNKPVQDNMTIKQDELWLKEQARATRLFEKTQVAASIAHSRVPITSSKLTTTSVDGRNYTVVMLLLELVSGVATLL